MSSDISVSRTVRIFISSTFRDFGEERDLLVRRVFPGLRARLKDRFVELVDVDLRWGITTEEAERGEILPICLAEIDRSRPFFVGLLGDRYGWVPATDHYASDLLERQPWLDELRGGKSVTELEILHGVLNDLKMAGHALFYFRSSAYAGKKGGDYLPGSAEDAERLRALKDRIRQSGFPVVEDYEDPEALAAQLEKDLWPILDEMYPVDEVPDAFEREQRRHDAYAAPRRRLYLGGDQYRWALDQALAKGAQRLVIEGQSGGGKSALIANWLAERQEKHPEDLVHVHYSGASADAVDPVSLVRRLCEVIKRQTGSDEEIPSDPQKLLESLSLWLAYASAHAAKEGKSWLIVLDALNALTDMRDLRWFPEFLPEGVRFVVSCLPGEVLEALRGKGEWEGLVVAPLNKQAAASLLTDYLKIYNKTLHPELVDRIIDHPLSTNPLFLRTLAEELRLFGVYEELSQRLDIYLESKTVDDLFERVLARVEGDCGAEAVQTVMEGIWASRAGLTEEEIQGFAKLPPARWAQIHYALDDALLESNGQIIFAHDYLRIAVSDRYLQGNNELSNETQSEEAIKLRQKAHRELAEWFENHAKKNGIINMRAAEEIPYQWQNAKEWSKLQTCLTSKDMFVMVCTKRSTNELLEYWQVLCREIGANIEENYKHAWMLWKLDETKEDTASVAGNLQSFLTYAGYYDDLPYDLCKLAVSVTEGISPLDHLLLSKYLNNLARILTYRGEYEAAEIICRKALNIREDILGLEHLDTAASLYNLGDLLFAAGKYESAEQYIQRALVIRNKVLGHEHPDTAECISSLAFMSYYKADFDSAEKLFRQALAIEQKVFGNNHPNTAATLDGLASTLNDMVEYEKALPLIRQSLDIHELTLGLDHPETAKCLYNYGRICKSSGDYDLAESLLRRALAIEERRLGVEHHETATSTMMLANVLYDKHDYDASEQLHERALAVNEKVLGPEHPETAACLINLANDKTAKGDLDTAESMYQRAIAINEKVLGPEHPDTASALQGLACVITAKNDYDNAEKLYKRALSVKENTLGPDHPDTAVALENLAYVYYNKKNYDRAETLYRQALVINEKRLGAEHPETARNLMCIAEVLAQRQSYDDAEKLCRRAIEIQEKVLCKEHRDIDNSLNVLAKLLITKGDNEAAELILQRSLIIEDNIFDFYHPITSNNRYYLARILYNKGDYVGAENLYQKVLIARERLCGKISAQTGSIYLELGETLRHLGRNNESEDCFRRGLLISDKLEGQEASSMAHILCDFGNYFADQGRFSDAENFMRKAISIASKNKDIDEHSYINILTCFGSTLRKANRIEEAYAELTQATILGDKVQNDMPFSELASVCILQDKPEEAAGLLLRCLELQKMKRPESDEYIKKTMNRLVDLFETLNRNIEADEMRKKINPNNL